MIRFLRSRLVLGFSAVLLVSCVSDSDSENVNHTGGAAGEGGFAGEAGEGAAAGQGGTGGSTGGTAGEAGGGAVGGTGAMGGTAGTGGTAGGTGGGGAAGPDATIQAGASDRFLLSGTVVTPDTFFDGQVLVEGDTITCVSPGTDCQSQGGAQGATIIETHGIIAPGFIDTHNHILFDIFGDEHWLPSIPSSCSTADDCESSKYCSKGKCNCVDNICRYKNHTQWTKEAEYGVMMDYKQCLEDASQGKPVWCPPTYKGDGRVRCEMNKYGELKGLIAGTTSIVGLPGTTAPCFSSLSRSIDLPQNGLSGDKIQTSAIFPPTASSASGVCTNYTDGKTDAYLIHVGEGVDDVALKEFTTLFTLTTPQGCLYAPGTAITHGTSFGKTEYEAMASAGMKLTWSPRSNVSLYGTTNDLALAIEAGVTISLGPDWSLGGSRNILEEMKFAKWWDDNHYGSILTTKDIVEMTTSNAASVLALSNTLGRLAPGYKADLVVVGGDTSVPYDALVAAWPSTVRLVMVGGVVLYGDNQLEVAGPSNPGCEALDVCGRAKFLCTAESSSANLLNQTFVQIRDNLNAALKDLDSIPVLPASDCNPACGADEECYKRTVMSVVDASLCPTACGAGEQCFQRAQSGNNMYGCMTTNACAPKRGKGYHPVTPLFACP